MSWLSDQQRPRAVRAAAKLADWARAWVENESGLMEAKRENLTEAESDALLLLAFLLEGLRK